MEVPPVVVWNHHLQCHTGHNHNSSTSSILIGCSTRNHPALGVAQNGHPIFAPFDSSGFSLLGLATHCPTDHNLVAVPFRRTHTQTHGGFQKWGYPKWMVFVRKNPSTNGWYTGTPNFRKPSYLGLSRGISANMDDSSKKCRKWTTKESQERSLIINHGDFPNKTWGLNQQG